MIPYRGLAPRLSRKAIAGLFVFCTCAIALLSCHASTSCWEESGAFELPISLISETIFGIPLRHPSPKPEQLDLR